MRAIMPIMTGWAWRNWFAHGRDAARAAGRRHRADRAPQPQAQRRRLQSLRRSARDRERARCRRPVQRRAISDQGFGRAGEGLAAHHRAAASPASMPMTEDSELVQRYRAAGVVLAGKTNTPEFGIPGVTTSARLGPCRNPWNPDHISGGSSGGAASAVAAGIVPLAHASDGLGSIRIPAACCGLVGMKTTRDRNPNGLHDTDRAIGLSVDHVVSPHGARQRRDAGRDGLSRSQRARSRIRRRSGPYLEEVSRAARANCASPGPAKRRRGKPIDAGDSGRARTHCGHAGKARPRCARRGAGHRLSPALSRAGTGLAPPIFRPASNAGSRSRAASRATTSRAWRGAATRPAKRISGQDAMWGWQQMRLMNRADPVAVRGLGRVSDAGARHQRAARRLSRSADGRPERVRRRQAETFGFTPPFNLTGQPSLSLPLWQSESGLPIGMMFTGEICRRRRRLIGWRGSWKKSCRGRIASRRSGAEGRRNRRTWRALRRHDPRNS